MEISKSVKSILPTLSRVIGSLTVAYLCRYSYKKIKEIRFNRSLKTWALNQPQDSSEKREEAIQRIFNNKPHFFLYERNTRSLDFQDLQLTDFPPLSNIVDRVVAIKASNNSFTQSPSLTQFKRLRMIDLSQNQIEQFPPIPRSTRGFSINLEGNSIKGIPADIFTLPPNYEINLLSNHGLSGQDINKILQNAKKGEGPTILFDCLTVDESGRCLQKIPEESYFQSQSPCIIDLTNNSIRNVPEEVLCLGPNYFFDLRNNPLSPKTEKKLTKYYATKRNLIGPEILFSKETTPSGKKRSVQKFLSAIRQQTSQLRTMTDSSSSSQES
jgi:hypothetical protein